MRVLPGLLSNIILGAIAGLIVFLFGDDLAVATGVTVTAVWQAATWVRSTP